MPPKPRRPCTEEWKVYDQAVADAPAKPAHIAEAAVAAAQEAVDRCYEAAAEYTPINQAITTEVVAASVDENGKKARFAVLFSGRIDRPGYPALELDRYLHGFTVSLTEIEDAEDTQEPDGEDVHADPPQARPEGDHHERADWA